jgi:3-oxoacyl-[acyl-carrier-protein] synthase-3
MKSIINSCVIKKIVSVVPKNEIHNKSLSFDEKTIKKVIKMTGVETRRLLAEKDSLENLYILAAKNILNDIDKNSIDAIFVITQTPEYRLPTTANILHGKLGLNKEAMAFDVNQGCSGYVYGLHLAMSLMQSNTNLNRILLCAGEALSKIVCSENKSTAFLFGDAATVTLLEKDDLGEATHFLLRSDGVGAENLIVRDGGIAHPFNETSYQIKEDKDGNLNADAYLYMNGAEIFNFSVEEVPSLINDLLTFSSKSIDDIDVFCLHQANKFMLDYLADKLGISSKTPSNIQKYGNTSSASIPLLITTMPDSCLKKMALLAGFGVGYSMAAALVDLSKTEVSFLEG